MRSERVFIPGPAGRLEALVERPVRPAAVSAVAVCCHPHPLFGGTLHSKVVHALARAAGQAGVPAVRFNFRGVGGSDGRYGDGNGETADARAVASWARQEFGAGRIWALGFSFGGLVAWRLAQSPDTGRLVMVAPPVARLGPAAPQGPECPWLVVQGDRDELVDHETVAGWARRAVPAPQLRLLPGADHFFHGRTTELRQVVAEWLRQTNGAAEAAPPVSR